MTGKGLSKLIDDNIQKYSIDNKYLWGQEYDGVASMSSKFNGAQAHTQKIIHSLAFICIALYIL